MSVIQCIKKLAKSNLGPAFLTTGVVLVPSPAPPSSARARCWAQPARAGGNPPISSGDSRLVQDWIGVSLSRTYKDRRAVFLLFFKRAIERDEEMPLPG